MMNQLDKKVLFLKVRKQNKEAFGQFYDLYVTRIYRFIFFKVNSVSDAQDLTSEVFLKLWQHIRDEKEIKNLNSFTYMVARNTVIDFYRSKARQEKSVDDENIKQIPDESKDMLQKQIIDSDLQNTLKGLEDLKDQYKEVLVLRFLDELSISEIAEVLNKSKGAVRVLIHRALRALKKSVDNEPR